MEAKVLTEHPAGKRGVNVSKDKYDAVRTSIIHCLRNGNALSYGELAKCVGEALDGFEGSINWYVEVVKLDLEAKRTIERIRAKPQRYRLVEA